MRPLSKMIVDSYKFSIEGILWVSLLVAIVVGAEAKGLLGLFLGLGVWLFASVLILGTFLVLVDIQERVEKIERSLKRKADKEA